MFDSPVTIRGAFDYQQVFPRFTDISLPPEYGILCDNVDCGRQTFVDQRASDPHRFLPIRTRTQHELTTIRGHL
jgi:hypothetical protein